MLHMELETAQSLPLASTNSKDLYSAEKQMHQGPCLPKMVKAALKLTRNCAAGFKLHLRTNRRCRPSAWKNSSPATAIPRRGPKCQGMEGVLKEGDADLLEEDATGRPYRDAGLPSPPPQRVEHYEMAGVRLRSAYLTPRNWVITTLPGFLPPATWPIHVASEDPQGDAPQKVDARSPSRLVNV